MRSLGRTCAALLLAALLVSCTSWQRQTPRQSDIILEIAEIELEKNDGGAAATAFLDRVGDRNDAEFASRAGGLLFDHYAYDAGVKWLTRAMMLGDRDAAVRLGDWFESRDTRAAFNAVQRTGDDDWLGRIAYHGGTNLPADHAHAAKLFRKAAVEGNAKAAVALGMMLESGDGVARDSVEATRWLVRAAEKGDRDALMEMILLGRERALPASVVAMPAFHEVRAFVANGEPFHAVTRAGFSVQGAFNGTVHFHPDRIDVEVDQATMWLMVGATAAERLRAVTVELGHPTKPPVCCWGTDAESRPVATEFTLQPGDRYAPPCPMHFVIPRDPMTRVDRHWLVFGIESVFGDNNAAGYCYAHTDRFLLSNDEARLPGQLALLKLPPRADR